MHWTKRRELMDTRESRAWEAEFKKVPAANKAAFEERVSRDALEKAQRDNKRGQTTAGEASKERSPSPGWDGLDTISVHDTEEWTDDPVSSDDSGLSLS